jgi:hypothetical protein
MRYYFLGFACLVGCATLPDDPASNPEASAPLTCIGKEQCDLYWQRAQAWIANTSTYRISLATDALIETYGPYPGKRELAYRITRIPQGDGACWQAPSRLASPSVRQRAERWRCYLARAVCEGFSSLSTA